MKYNIEKINLIAQKLAEVVQEAIAEEGSGTERIGEVEMVLREGLREIGQGALRCYLENEDGEREAEIRCACGGKLKISTRAEGDDLVGVWESNLCASLLCGLPVWSGTSAGGPTLGH